MLEVLVSIGEMDICKNLQKLYYDRSVDCWGVVMDEWKSVEYALNYLRMADSIPHRTEGESALL